MDNMDETTNPIVKLMPPSQYLAPCPKFRVLVLGNPESTKQELFSKVFGVDLEKKLVADAFSPTHDINVPLNLEGQNEHLEIYTSPNFYSPVSTTSASLPSTSSTVPSTSPLSPFTTTSSDDPSHTLASQTLRTVAAFIAQHTSLANVESVAPDIITHDTRLHCIYYCVSTSDPSRSISPVESYFFHHLSSIVPHHVPVLLLFTKYDEFVSSVQMDWIKEAQEKGMSKVAVAHILRDLVTKRFEDLVGKRWEGLLREVDGGMKERRDSGFGYGGGDRKELHLEDEGRRQGGRREVVRVLVGGGGESEQDWGGEPAWGEELEAGVEGGGYGELVKKTMEGLRESKEVRRAFAAAQRCLAGVSSQFAADLASTYFETSTSHARKLHGVDVREIMPNFFHKAIQLFNLRDVSAVLTTTPNLLVRILTATFGADQRILVDESLSHPSTEDTIFLHLSPHERAVMLCQAMSSIILFLHKLADIQWPHHPNFSHQLPPSTITPHHLTQVLHDLETGTEKRELLEEIEASPLFTSCRMRQELADLIYESVERADKGAASHYTREEMRGKGGGVWTMVDDRDLQELSLAFVNDKGPDDMVLPNGLRILPLN